MREGKLNGRLRQTLDEEGGQQYMARTKVREDTARQSARNTQSSRTSPGVGPFTEAQGILTHF